jgi:hypothetical protein
VILTAVGCSSDCATSAILTKGPSDGFGSHWYDGRAEITSYDLSQARYGEIHPGTAVLLFVTEDVSRSRQVKLDDPESAGSDRVKVLKLNATRSFTTGIYPYSVMTSTFTPVQRGRDGNMIKATGSVQEWCGQTFAQLNRSESGYHLRQYSYFESDGDLDVTVEAELVEDEIWSIIRLNPDLLPIGAVNIIPGMVYQRLRHGAWRAEPAEAALEVADEAGMMTYEIRYRDIDRSLRITYAASFPHQIEGWEETTASGFGADARPLTTTATRRGRIRTAYWTQNRREDAGLRSELGLTP